MTIKQIIQLVTAKLKSGLKVGDKVRLGKFEFKVTKIEETK